MDTPAEDGANPVYTLEGFDDVTVNKTLLGTLVNNGNGLTSTALIEENCTDLAKFGLAEPKVTVEYTYESGGTAKFYVGNNAPTNSGVYVMAEGNNTVYTVSLSSMSNFTNTTKDFIEKTVLEAPENQEDYPKINKLTIERDDLDSNIVLEYDKSSEDKYSGGTSSTHIMTEPVECNLSGDASETVLTGMFGLYANDVYAVHCKESDIAGAGLNEPFCRVTMDCEDRDDYVLLLSEVFTDDDGDKCCYGMFEGGKVIYIISEENAVWLKTTPIDIISKMMVSSYVWNITDFKVSGNNGASADFKIKPIDSSKPMSESKTEDFEVKKDGEIFDSERYRQFYAFLISGSLEEFALGKPVPDGEPMASVEYTDSYSKKTYKYDFYDDSLMQALITVNGESKFYCSKAFVNTLIDNIKRIDTGEDYVKTW